MKINGKILTMEDDRIISIKQTWQRFQGLKYAAGENNALAQGKTVMEGLERLGLIVRSAADESVTVPAGWEITEKGRTQLSGWKNPNK